MNKCFCLDFLIKFSSFSFRTVFFSYTCTWDLKHKFRRKEGGEGTRGEEKELYPSFSFKVSTEMK